MGPLSRLDGISGLGLDDYTSLIVEKVVEDGKKGEHKQKYLLPVQASLSFRLYEII